MHCSKCGAELKEGANFCPICGNLIKPGEAQPFLQNDSGQGRTAVLPAELRRWNWGAFLLGWIWAIGNNVWIGLLALVPGPALLLVDVLAPGRNKVWIVLLGLVLPYAGFIMHFLLGAEGNDWAWQQKRWESVEQFRRIQKRWANWAVGLLIASLVIALLVLVASKAQKTGI